MIITLPIRPRFGMSEESFAGFSIILHLQAEMSLSCFSPAVYRTDARFFTTMRRVLL